MNKKDQPYIFISRKVNKRLLSTKVLLERHMIIDHIGRTIIINKDLCYQECLILERYYQGYIIDVHGYVYIDSQKLEILPNILFNRVKKISKKRWIRINHIYLSHAGLIKDYYFLKRD